MITSVVAAACALLATNLPASRQGCIVVSTDDSLVSRVRKEIRSDSKIEEFAKGFGGRLRVYEADDQTPILVDRESGTIGDAYNRQNLADGLAQTFSQESPAAVLGSLDERAKKAVLSFLGKYFPEGSLPDGFNLEAAGIGFHASVNFDVQGSGGEARKLSLTLVNDITEKRDEQLGMNPVPMRTGLTRDEINAIDKVGQEDERRRDQVAYHLIGRSREDPIRSHDRVSKLIKSILTELASAEKAALGGLMDKFADLFGEARFGPGDQTFSKLPKSVQDQLLKHVRSSWQGYGFESQEQAENYLLNSKSMSVSTTLSIAICRRPRDPANGRGGSFGAFGFGKVEGTLPP